MPRHSTLLPAAVVSLVLAFGSGCGSSGTTPAPAPRPAYPAITSFVAATNSITAGASTTLTADFSNGTGTLTPGGAITSGSPVTVTPARTTVYTLAVTNSASQVVTASVELTVVAAPAIETFTAGQSPVAPGQATAITATFRDGTGSIDDGAGTVTPVSSGVSVEVVPAKTTTYTLTVTNALGAAATRPLTVVVDAAVPAQVSGASLFAQDRVHAGDDTSLASVSFPAGAGRTVAWALGSGTANGATDQEVLSFKAPATTGAFAVSAVVQDAAGTATLTQPIDAVTDASLLDPHDTRQRGAAAVLLADGRVLVTGSLDVFTPDYGWVPNELTPPVNTPWSGATAGGDLFDPLTGTWKPVGSMARPRLSHTMTLLPNGRVLVAGGVGQALVSGQLAACELYDPTTRRFVPAAPMAAHRAAHTATLLPSGKVLVAGGMGLASVRVLSTEVYDPATDTWTAAGTTTAHEAGAAVLLPTGKVLLVGGAGSTGAELYDPATNGWSAATTPLVVGQAGTSAVLLPSGKVLVSNGGTTSSTELYDPVAGTWAAAASRSVSGTGAVRLALLQNGQVLAVGATPASTPELYDPATNTWRAAARMTASRAKLAELLPLPNGKVMALGGGQDAADPEFYDPLANAWTSGGTASFPRSLHQAIPLADGRVLVAGGGVLQAEVYDPATGWSRAGTMLAQRSFFGAVRLLDGRVLAAGGPDATAELYDPKTNAWKAAASMSLARTRFTLTLLPDGRALAVGGGNDNLGNLDSAELYDPATDRWTAAASLTGGRRNHSATLLPSGKVLVAGGVSRIGAVDTAQLYDPATDTWAPAGNMTSVRQYQTATLLPSGQVLLAGGADTYNSLSSAELYDPATNLFTATNPLVGATRRGTATLLPDGRVLVLGGLDVDPGGSPFLTNGATRPTGQVFDPATGRWSASGDLAVPRADHAATLLGNGKVLVTGGTFTQLLYVPINNWISQVYVVNHPMSSAELWK